jgi:hypothetical protein
MTDPRSCSGPLWTVPRPQAEIGLHFCLACRRRENGREHQDAWTARGRAPTLALLAVAAACAVLAYQCAQLCSAVARAADVTREAALLARSASAVSLRPGREVIPHPEPIPPLEGYTPKPSTPVPPPVPCKGSSTACQAAQLARLRWAIVRERENDYRLERWLVDAILEEQSTLMARVRIVPEQENGKTVGIRLLGVRPDSFLGLLGFRDGDRLETVNGFDLSTPEHTIEAYSRLRSAEMLEVRVKRNGKPVTLNYEFR